MKFTYVAFSDSFDLMSTDDSMTDADTGHSHNLSISCRYTKQWAGGGARQVDHAKVGDLVVPCYASDLTLRRNLPGTRQLISFRCSATIAGKTLTS
jgi:hypothetical protein